MKSIDILDDFPEVDSFFGVEVKTGSFIIATLGIVHPIFYVCTCFLPMSYVMVSIWILLVFYFTASLGLFFGLTKDNATICGVWIWCTIIIATALALLIFLLMLAYTLRQQYNRALLAFLGIIWYMLTIYFIFVVNTHRKQLRNNNSEPTTFKPTRTTPEGPPIKMMRVCSEGEPDSTTMVDMSLEIDQNKETESKNVLQNARRSLLEKTNKTLAISTTSSMPEDALTEIKTTISTTERSTEFMRRSFDEIPPDDNGEIVADEVE